MLIQPIDYLLVALDDLAVAVALDQGTALSSGGVMPITFGRTAL